MDEQNAQTSASTSSLAEAFVTVAVTAAGQVVTTSTARTERGLEPIQGKAFFFLSGAFKACSRSLKDGAYYCYCAYILRIFRYSDFLLPMLTNTGIFLLGLKLSGESKS